MSLTGDAKDIVRVSTHQGIVSLHVGGVDEPLNVLVREVQHDHLGNEILHIDFVQVRMDVEIAAEVPVILHGDAVGLSEGGETNHVLHDLEIRCLPGDIPEEIVVEVAELHLHDSLTIADLALPEGVVATGEPGATVVSIIEPRMAEAEEPEGEEGELLEGEEGAEAEGGGGDAGDDGAADE
jgi:large subunit ribosomal protein L25